MRYLTIISLVGFLFAAVFYNFFWLALFLAIIILAI